mmetsp:Transcript_14851/g.38655  ORF Transcript_14851/g.38655 Transcript_14851/m.38655 type:complete len:292 (+) Transcript_14851:88-963(+)
MGCAASSQKNPGEQSYDAAKAAVQKETALKPVSEEGRSEQKQLDLDFKALTEQIRQAQADDPAAINIGKVTEIIAASEYARHLAESISITREFDAGWATFRYPDNGQWKVAMDKTSGQVMMQPVAKVLGAQIGLSFAPMRSQVDSAGYRDMFINNLKRVYSNLPTTIQGKVITSWEMEPYTGPYTVGESAGAGGLEVYEWYIRSKMMHESMKLIGVTQIEVHGMRNEAQPTKGGFQYFGFNASMSAAGYPDGAHVAVERVFREVVLASLHIKSIDVIEKQLIGFWKGASKA